MVEVGFLRSIEFAGSARFSSFARCCECVERSGHELCPEAGNEECRDWHGRDLGESIRTLRRI
jgi:hypothetical protein